MTTIRKYLDLVNAEMDKSLLEAAGITAFIADENSAALGYGQILGGVRLQVQDADADRARQVGDRIGLTVAIPARSLSAWATLLVGLTLSELSHALKTQSHCCWP
jgi:hypothetical protein